MNKWKNLIFTHQIREILFLFNSIFLGIYFLKITEGNIITVSIYYILYYLSHIVWRYLASKFLTPNRVIKIYRFGLLTNLLVSLILLLLQENIVKYIYIFAIVYGLSQSIYWAAYEVIISDINNKDNFNKYFTYDSVLYNISSIIFPTIFGVVIERYSYSLVFIILLAITIISFIFSLSIKDIKINCKAVNIRNFKKNIKNRKLLGIMGLQSICDGLTNGGVIQLLSTLILYNNIQSEETIGILSSITAIICIVVAVIAERKVNYNNYSKIVLPIELLIFLITIPISIKATVILMIIYNVSIAIGDVLINIEGNSLMFKGLEEITTVDFKTDYFCFLEFTLNMGRTIGLVIIIIFAKLFNNINALIVLFIFFSAFFVIRTLVIVKLQKCIKINN